jgi:hypothetical protein
VVFAVSPLIEPVKVPVENEPLSVDVETPVTIAESVLDANPREVMLAESPSAVTLPFKVADEVVMDVAAFVETPGGSAAKLSVCANSM